MHDTVGVVHQNERTTQAKHVMGPSDALCVECLFNKMLGCQQRAPSYEMELLIA